tara:strand:+ start:252 stop:479 length:228 start_codon:yes stop_codon:yes gene_type:complete
MKIGDLVKLKKCQKRCVCPVCMSNGSRLGVVVESWTDEADGTSVMVQFDDMVLLPYWSHHNAGDVFSARNLEVIE